MRCTVFHAIMVAALPLLFQGCATYVTVSADPPGAEVFARGSGRPGYRWAARGTAPATFKSHHSAVQTTVVWPDGQRDEIVRTPLSGKSNVHIRHRRDGDPRLEDGP